MNWIGELASFLPAPVAGGVTAAVALYAGAVAVERKAKTDALHDIAKAIRSVGDFHKLSVVTGITMLFWSTFGKRHLSWKCVRRSCGASVLFIVVLTVPSSIASHGNLSDFLYAAFRSLEKYTLLKVSIILACVALVAIADYIALLKTRLILAHLLKTSHILTIVATDVIVSVFIPLSFWFLIPALCFKLFRDYYMPWFVFRSPDTGELTDALIRERFFRIQKTIDIWKYYFDTFPSVIKRHREPIQGRH